MLKLSNQQTNKQTGQKQYVPAIATGDIKTNPNFIFRDIVDIYLIYTSSDKAHFFN